MTHQPKYQKVSDADYQHEKGDHFIPVQPIDGSGASRVAKHYAMQKALGYKQVKVWILPPFISELKSYANELNTHGLTNSVAKVLPQAKPKAIASAPHPQLGHIEPDALPKMIEYLERQNAIAKALNK